MTRAANPPRKMLPRPFRISHSELDWESHLDSGAHLPPQGVIDHAAVAAKPVRWKTLTGRAEQPSRTLSSGFAEIDAGGRLDPHRHAEDEVYYILEGRGVMTLGTGPSAETHVVGPGDAIFIPGDTTHAIAALDGEPVRFFYVFASDRFHDIRYVFDGD